MSQTPSVGVSMLDDELWDVLDCAGQPTGRTITRLRDGRDPHSLLHDHEWHRAVQACIFNHKGEMLIQQRASAKAERPNLWDLTAGGAVVAGETSRQAATRELREELGIDHDFADTPPRLTLTDRCDFFDIYLADIDCNLDTLTLQPEEVQAVRWAGLPQTLSMIRDGSFCPFHPSLIELIFALHDLPNWFTLPPADASRVDATSPPTVRMVEPESTDLRLLRDPMRARWLRRHRSTDVQSAFAPIGLAIAPTWCRSRRRISVDSG